MIWKLGIILFFLMVLIGGNRGLDSFLALVRTLLALLVNVYLISWGAPPILTTLVISIFIIVTVIYFQNGVNAKMHAAVISVIAVIFFIMMTSGPLLWAAGISGYNEIEQYEEISMYLSSDLQISMSAVMLSSVLLGLLGAIMDTAVAVTTAVNEVYENKKELDAKQLFISGLAVGRDILGTTVNTLFFAGVGESIMLAVLFTKNEDEFAYILNSKALFKELAGLLTGGMGCLLIIPVSSIICAVLLTISQDVGSDSENLLQKCYIYFKKVLKNVKYVLK